MDALPGLIFVIALAGVSSLHGIEPPIPSVLATPHETMEFRFQGDADHHYLLYRSLDLTETGDLVDMVLGDAGPLILKDRLRASPPQAYYRIQQVSNNDSADTDGDGISDYREMLPSLFDPGVPRGNPFNPIADLQTADGTFLLTKDQWVAFSETPEGARISPELTGTAFLKFVALPLHEGRPAVIFMNTKRHSGHARFIPNVMEGIYKIPNTGVLRGELGFVKDAADQDWYIFNFQPGDSPDFEMIRLVYHLLAVNMPFIEGNLAYRPFDSSLIVYRRDQHLYEGAGIPIWLDEDRPGTNDYVALNAGEAYGLLQVFNPDERPSILDVAIYRQLPNDVPLLRGIITETPQTPLSHVNLRAVQNHNPNAYVRAASMHPDIEPLIGKYVRYAVRPEGFEIEEVTLEVVEAHLETLRPLEEQFPPRDLEAKEILPLDQLGFESSSSIGAKAANVAELMTEAISMDIPREVFPEMGYAIPFYYYDVFMKHNGFYQVAETMIGDPAFQQDPLKRDEALSRFRKTIKDGKMPLWMTEALREVQNEFPVGQGIRCRSSTNNAAIPQDIDRGWPNPVTPAASRGLALTSAR